MELREKLLDSLDAFNIPYRDEQKSSRTWQCLILSRFELKRTHTRYKETDTTKCIGKHVAISASLSSILIQEPFFLCHTNPHHLVSSFITVPEGLATQSKTPMTLKFIDVEIAIKVKLCKIPD